MSKKFITVESGKVQLIHCMPFDAKEGLGKTEEELLKKGYLLDDIPEPQRIEGKIAEAHYTPEKGFYYEYIDAPNSQNMTLVQAVKNGKISPEQFKKITGMPYTA